MTHPSGPGRPPTGERPDEQALLLVAGVADLVADTLGTAAGTLRSLLGRSDTGALARDAAEDLKARGRLALDRLAPHRHGAGSPPSMELLAREVLARRAAAAGTPDE